MGTVSDMGDRPEVPGYRLTHVLGVGGAGTVWGAERADDGLSVAVKVVHAGGAGAADRAARELAVLSRVSVPGLVAFHEAVALDTDPPCLAIVLGRALGGSLHAAVAARGHLSVGESVTVLAPVVQTLAGLHAIGVVHGDLSPGNVLLERSGRPLVADLGVARLVGHGPEGRYGTPGFVAPEVAAGAAPTSASDVYAAGALAWWCVTGQPPGPAALRTPLGDLAPGLPEAWLSATLAALAGDPGRRPTATELAVAYFDSAPCEPLRLVVGTDDTALLTRRLRDARPPDPPASAEPRVAPRGPARARRTAPRRRGPTRPRDRGAGRPVVPTWLAPVVIAVVVVAGIAGFAVFGGAGGLDPLAGRSGPRAVARVDRAAAAARPPDLAADRLAAQRDPQGLLQALADRRAAALNGGTSADLARLADLDVAGSPAQAVDLALGETVRAHRQSYRGVRLQVGSAHALQAKTGALATIDAVVDTSAYAVVDPTGVARPVAAARGAPMRFSLRWVDRSWRIEQVAPVPPGHR